MALQRDRFLDIESSTLLEQKYLLNKALDYDLEVIVLMMHSFSFCRDDSTCPQTRTIERFEGLLQHISESPEFQAMTFKEFWAGSSPATESGDGEAPIPEVGYWITLYRAVARFNEGGMNAAFATANGLALIALLLFVLWGYRSLRNRRRAQTR